MKIEIVEFYPLGKIGKKFKGTMHVYLIDTEQDIRGITVFKDGKRWWFRLPHHCQYDNETKQIVWFPIISFTNIDKNKELFNLIILKGKQYIINNFMKPDDLAKKEKSV